MDLTLSGLGAFPSEDKTDSPVNVWSATSTEIVEGNFITGLNTVATRPLRPTDSAISAITIDYYQTQFVCVFVWTVKEGITGSVERRCSPVKPDVPESTLPITNSINLSSLTAFASSLSHLSLLSLTTLYLALNF